MSCGEPTRSEGPPAIVVRWAETDRELLQLYRLRARVFYGEGILNGDEDGELFDIYDCYRSTRNVVALQVDGDGSARVVGGCRITNPTDGVGILDSPLYDFRPAVGSHERTTALGSMLCVDPVARGRHDIGRRVIEFAVANGLPTGITGVCSAVRPGMVGFLTNLGWKVLEPEFVHPTERVSVVPMLWRMRDGGGAAPVAGDGIAERSRMTMGR